MFADSCNFLHGANTQNPSVIHYNGQRTKVKHPFHVNMSFSSSPTASTASPPSTNHETSFASPRSPNRSPRISGLLLALQDVIGPTVDGDDDSNEDSASNDNCISYESDELQSFNSYYSHSFVPSKTDSSQSHSHDDSQTHPRNVSLHGDDPGNVTEEDIRRLAQLTLASAVSTVTEDLPEEETPTAEQDNPLCAPSLGADTDQPHLPQSQPQPQPPTSLLSPVDMSITPLRRREESVDSGYADDDNNWSGPLQLSASPPKSRKQTVGVSFIFESPSSRGSPVLIYDGHDPFSSAAESVFFSPPRATSTSPLPYHSPADIALPPSPVYDDEEGVSPTDPSNLTDDDVPIAIKRESPLQFLASEGPAFEESEPGVHSSLGDAVRSLKSLMAEHDGDAGSDQGSPTINPHPPLPPGLASEPDSNSFQNRSASPVDVLASAKRKWGAVIGELSMLSLYSQPLEERKSGSPTPPSAPTQLLAIGPQVVVDNTMTPRNNTLDSVYECYSLDGEGDTSSGPSTSASTSTSISSISSALSPTSPATSAPIGDCERVFIPPPLPPPPSRGRTSTIQSSSVAVHRSASSPTAVGLGSPFQEPVATGTREDKGKAKGKGKAPVGPGGVVSVSERSWDDAMDAGSISTRVPFGFRYPFSLVCLLRRYRRSVLPFFSFLLNANCLLESRTVKFFRQLSTGPEHVALSLQTHRFRLFEAEITSKHSFKKSIDYPSIPFS
jgi:hypothetical protein